jgi:predicted nuclease of restriction endonuclease-like (RecB) superfamily
LIYVKDEEARLYYVREAVKQRLKAEELRHQISKKVYERQEKYGGDYDDARYPPSNRSFE